MSTQPAAPPLGQPTIQSASAAAATPQANAKTAAETRRTAILAAYDILRPAGEVDSRAQRVLVTALVLIALCVVPEKPTAVSFGGLSFSLVIGQLVDRIGYTPVFASLSVFDLIGATLLIILMRGVKRDVRPHHVDNNASTAA